MEPDSEQKAEGSFLLRAGNLAAGTFNANVSADCVLPALGIAWHGFSECLARPWSERGLVCTELLLCPC